MVLAATGGSTLSSATAVTGVSIVTVPGMALPNMESAADTAIGIRISLSTKPQERQVRNATRRPSHRATATTYDRATSNCMEETRARVSTTSLAPPTTKDQSAALLRPTFKAPVRLSACELRRWVVSASLAVTRQATSVMMTFTVTTTHSTGLQPKAAASAPNTTTTPVARTRDATTLPSLPATPTTSSNTGLGSCHPEKLVPVSVGNHNAVARTRDATMLRSRPATPTTSNRTTNGSCPREPAVHVSVGNNRRHNAVRPEDVATTRRSLRATAATCSRTTNGSCPLEPAALASTSCSERTATKCPFRDYRVLSCKRSTDLRQTPFPRVHNSFVNNIPTFILETSH